jgi:hypothetical protein
VVRNVAKFARYSLNGMAYGVLVAATD